MHESNAEQLQASTVLPIRAYPALRGALTGAPCESCSMQEARDAQERGLEAGAGSGGGRADCICSNVSHGVKGVSSRGDEARRVDTVENLVALHVLAVESGLRLLTHSITATKYAYSTGMSSLFGNRAGAVSNPSDSAAKAQQIKQEVAQQLGTLAISLDHTRGRVLTQCTHSPRECSGTHQRTLIFSSRLCPRDPI